MGNNKFMRKNQKKCETLTIGIRHNAWFAFASMIFICRKLRLDGSSTFLLWLRICKVKWYLWIMCKWNNLSANISWCIREEYLKCILNVRSLNFLILLFTLCVCMCSFCSFAIAIFPHNNQNNQKMMRSWRRKE